jgi:sporulation protein YlmC with PRC-barrel domain
MFFRYCHLWFKEDALMNIKGTFRTWGKLFTMSAAGLLLASQAVVTAQAQDQQTQRMPSGAAPSMPQSDDVTTPGPQVEVPRRDESLTRRQQTRQIEQDQRAAEDPEADLTVGTDLNEQESQNQQERQAQQGEQNQQGQQITEIGQQQQQEQERDLAVGTDQNQQQRQNQQERQAQQNQQGQQNLQAQQNQQAQQGQQQGQQTDPAAAAVISITAITQVPVEDIPGRTVVNLEGEEIGEVEDVVTREATLESGLVVSVGGVLGIGDKDVFVDLDDVHLAEDKVVWEGFAGEEALENLPEYDEENYISAR